MFMLDFEKTNCQNSDSDQREQKGRSCKQTENQDHPGGKRRCCEKRGNHH